MRSPFPFLFIRHSLFRESIISLYQFPSAPVLLVSVLRLTTLPEECVEQGLNILAGSTGSFLRCSSHMNIWLGRAIRVPKECPGNSAIRKATQMDTGL